MIISKFSPDENNLRLNRFSDEIVRIGSVNPNKIVNNHSGILITIDKCSLYDGNDIYSYNDIKKILIKYRYKTLIFESIDLLSSVIREDLPKNIQFLDHYLKVELPEISLNAKEKYTYYSEILNKFNIQLDNKSFFHWETQKYQYKIERKLRTKSMLDTAFFFAPHILFSEPFIFKLYDKSHTIFVIDINSAFPSFLKDNNFPEPKTLQYDNKIKDLINKHGIFKVELKIKDEYLQYINQFNPFKVYNKQLQLVNVHFVKDMVYHTLLNENEISFFAKYMYIKVLEGVYSKNTINHPLKNEIIKLIEQKTETNDIIEKQLIKNKLMAIYSCASKVKLKSITDENHLIDAAFENTKYLNEKSFFKVDNNENLYVFGHYARSGTTLKLMRMIDVLVNKYQAKICYSNIDSLHVAIPNEYKDSIFDDQVFEDTKIECVAAGGLWIGPGKYLLFDNEYRLLKSSGIGRAKPGEVSKKYKVIENGVIIEKTMSMFNPIYSAKEIIKDGDVFIFINSNSDNTVNNYKYIKNNLLFYRAKTKK